ncbi:hypothetical protein V8F20_001527 [Naviculisporaceae sp. PSN 640]
MAAALPPNVDLSTIPLAPNPNGDPPNFAAGESLYPTVIATGSIFITFSLILVALRVHTGLKKSGRLFADDWLCLVAEGTAIAQLAVLSSILAKGLGRHTWDVPVSAVTPYVLKLQVSNQMLSAIAHLAIKSSMSLFFIRLFGTLRWVRVVCYSVLLLCFLAYLSFEISALLFCVPRHGEGWDFVLLSRCASIAPSTVAVGICSVIADVIIFLMPFYIIAGLALSRTKKQGLVVIFLFGFLIVVTGVASLAYRIVVSYYTTDVVWAGANVSITAYVEIFGTIIISCAPCLPSFWSATVTQTRFYSRLSSSSSLPFFRSSRRSNRGAVTNPVTAPALGYKWSISHKRSNTLKIRESRCHDDSETSEGMPIQGASITTTPSPVAVTHSARTIEKSTTISQEVHQQAGIASSWRNGEWEIKTTSQEW